MRKKKIVNIDEGIHRRAKIAATLKGINIRQYIMQLIERDTKGMKLPKVGQ